MTCAEGRERLDRRMWARIAITGFIALAGSSLHSMPTMAGPSGTAYGEAGQSKTPVSPRPNVRWFEFMRHNGEKLRVVSRDSLETITKEVEAKYPADNPPPLLTGISDAPPIGRERSFDGRPKPPSTLPRQEVIQSKG